METETLETIEIRHDGPIDWLTLNRPGSLNSINGQMAKEMRDYFWHLQDHSATRIVVLQGAGSSFCAGLDLKSGGRMVDSDGREPVGRGFGFQGFLADVYVLMRRCPQPILSLVQGNACGGGFAFVLASDIRIAAEGARMNAAFVKLGLSACDMGTSYFLPRLVGTNLASELMMTGRFLGAERALATGLVSEVVAKDGLLEAAQPYLDEMLATSPQGLRLTKEGLNKAIDAPNLQAAMAIENRNQLMCSRTKDFQEGMTAFIEKRPPVYQDR